MGQIFMKGNQNPQYGHALHACPVVSQFLNLSQVELFVYIAVCPLLMSLCSHESYL